MIDIALRRQRISFFARCIGRLDLVSFRAAADWLARESNSIVRNEARREQAYQDLAQSILDGEFGGRPVVLRMPQFPEQLAARGHYQLRVWIAHAAWLLAMDRDPKIEFVGTSRYAGFGDFFAPRALMLAWFAARELTPPPNFVADHALFPEDNNSAEKWMLDLAGRSPRKLKREDTIKSCMCATGASWREALAAYKTLPADKRYSRGAPPK